MLDALLLPHPVLDFGIERYSVCLSEGVGQIRWHNEHRSGVPDYQINRRCTDPHGLMAGTVLVQQCCVRRTGRNAKTFLRADPSRP